MKNIRKISRVAKVFAEYTKDLQEHNCQAVVGKRGLNAKACSRSNSSRCGREQSLPRIAETYPRLLTSPGYDW